MVAEVGDQMTVAGLVRAVGLVLVHAVDLAPVPDLPGRLDHENGAVSMRLFAFDSVLSLNSISVV